MHTLQHLFEDTLKDIYYAEKAILNALPKMAKKAHSKDLRAAFEEHVQQTQTQVQRLEEIFSLLGKPAQGKTCPAIDGLIEEANELIKSGKNPGVLDAGMLASAQSVEHYEISRYGTLSAWAEMLDMGDVVQLLEQTLEEEKAADEKLTELAESEINIVASEETTGAS